MMAIGQSNICACCSEQHKAFDFWLGSWEVTTADGSLAGTNMIEKEEEDCILIEHWVSANGKNTGSSTNFYNLKTKQWEQLWIDNSGTHLKLKGNRVGDQMIMSSNPSIRKDGKAYVDRIIWTLNADGSVRQLWEVLHKDEVVRVAFDGLYQKKE